MVKPTADEQLRRVEQVRHFLADYEARGYRLEPDEVDNIDYLLREWAGLADVWDSLSADERKSQWLNSVFPPLLRAAQEEFTRTADWIESQREAIAEKWIPALADKKRIALDRRIESLRAAARLGEDGFSMMALHAIASGNNHPENLWASIAVTAFAARERPASLDDLGIAKLRGDLLMTIAELNRSLFLAVRPYAEIGLPAEETRARAANAGGAARRQLVPDDLETKWEKEAQKQRRQHPKATPTSIARWTAKKIGGSYHTLRKRKWFVDLMKSDLSAG